MATITVGVKNVLEFFTLYWQYIIVPIIYLIFAFFVTIKVAEKAIETKFEKLVLWFIVYPFVLFDWLMNMTVMTVVCFDLPASRTEVVTARMKRYKRAYQFVEPPRLIDKWRSWFSFFLCDIANAITEDHC